MQLLTVVLSMQAKSSPHLVFSYINDTLDMPHGFGCYGNHFGAKVYVTIVTKIGILLNWLAHGEYSVYATV